MGRHEKDLSLIKKQIVQELLENDGLLLKSLCESMYEKHKTKKNYTSDAYMELDNEGVIDVSTVKSEKGHDMYFLKLSENVITRKIKQIHLWAKQFPNEQKPFLEKLRKNMIFKEVKAKQSSKGYSYKINPIIYQDLRRITDQMTNLYQHIFALGLAYDMDIIPKVYEKPINKAKKVGIKFIKDSVARTVACEKKHPEVLKQYLISLFSSELIELGYYEKYHEEIKSR